MQRKQQLKKIYLFISAITLLGMVNIASFAATDTLASDVTEFSKGTRTISGNPASVNIFAGTGTLQSYLEKKLAIHNNHGIRIGGMILSDINDLFSGGIPDADRWTNNNLFLLDFSLNTQKAFGLKGGLFDLQLLQFNGQPTNAQAGAVQGYNSLPGAPPLNRSELYQIWYRQTLLDKKLIIRVGKSVPTFDFDNVSKPLPLKTNYVSIGAITSLLYTPIFVNPSMLDVMPGYYNSAYGVTINVIPKKQWYISYGIYDGSVAAGKQTGLTGPTFKSNYFNIAETGIDWLLGANRLPGNIGVGAWYQSGLIKNFANMTERGAAGYYLFGAQRFWYQHPSYDNSGIVGFYQFGENTSHVLPMPKYVGGGLTGFGLIPRRSDDSLGVGVSYAWLNKVLFTRHQEIMYQAYYQTELVKNILYLEPALSYIPKPGAMPTLNAAWAGTLRLILLF